MYNSSSFVLAGAVWLFFGQMIRRMEYSPVSLGTLLMTVIVNSCLTWPISFIQLFNGIPFRYGGSILLPLGTLLVIALIDLFLTLPTLLIQVFCGIPIRSYVGTFSFCYLHAALLVFFLAWNLVLHLQASFWVGFPFACWLGVAWILIPLSVCCWWQWNMSISIRCWYCLSPNSDCSWVVV